MKYLLFFISLFVVSSLQAQEKSLLWEVSGNGISSPSFLFGTMHLRDSRLMCLPDSAQYRLKKCSVLALEVVIDFNDRKALLASLLVQHDSLTLPNILNKQEYKKVRKAVKSYCDLPTLLMMDKIRPLMLAASLMEAQHKSDITYPMDLQFQLDAQNASKQLYSLESVAAQIAIFDKIPLELQKQELLASVDSMQRNKILLDSMVSLYLKQDLSALSSFSESSSSAIDSLFQTELLDKRNKIMVDGIKKMLSQGNAFIAVGAAHLSGEEGLIALLRKEGYVVRPVFSKCTMNNN